MKYILLFIFSGINLSLASGQNIITFEKEYGSIKLETGNSVVQTADSGYIVTGGTESYGHGLRDVYLIRTDKYGNGLWQKTYGTAAMDFGSCLQPVSDGGYIVVGRTRSLANDDIYLLRVDEMGNVKWSKTFGAKGYDWARYVQETNDKGFFIVGTIDTPVGTYQDVYAIKTDSLGNVQWERNLGSQFPDEGYSGLQTSDGNFIVAGYTGSIINTYDVYLAKLDITGNLIWQKNYGGADFDIGFDVAETSDSGFVITGWTLNNVIKGGHNDIILTG